MPHGLAIPTRMGFLRCLLCDPPSQIDNRDPLKQVEIIVNLINQFNVKQAVADIGYGAVQVSELKKIFAGRVLGYQCVRRPELSLERETTDEYGNKIAQLYLLADRSFWIISAIGLVKFKDKNEAVWPHMIIPCAYLASVEWSFDHFTCIEMEEQETVSGKRHHHGIRLNKVGKSNCKCDNCQKQAIKAENSSTIRFRSSVVLDGFTFAF